MAEQLNRRTFITNRSLEFFSEKELSMQIGHSKGLWPIALVKELIDNSLDACETAGILPEIEVTVTEDFVSIKDNGPGLPEETLKKSLDYMIRVSDKNHYVSPSRGQLGNALKCVWAAPFVMNGETGRVEISTGGKTHRIDVSVDRIAQRPKLKHTVIEGGFVKNGTFVKMSLLGIASILENRGLEDPYNSLDVTKLLNGYSAFNPHASFYHRGIDFEATNTRKSQDWAKWLPSNPTSAHWYDTERLRVLIGAYISSERDGGREKTVRKFVSEFRGLSSTQKQKRVTEAMALSRAYLHDLVKDDNVDIELVQQLLAVMKENSQPVKPKALGIIGEDHLKSWMADSYVQAESVKYKSVSGDIDGLPYILEVAFGVYTPEYSDCHGEIVTGLNWSPTLQNPFEDLSGILSDVKVQSWDPVVLMVHLAYPRLDFTDRGKSKLQLPLEIEEALNKAVKTVTKKFTIQKKKADREDRLHNRQLEELRKEKKRRQMSIKEAAFEVMEAAYMKASDNNRLPANARQIMYAARPGVIELAGKCWKNSSYFTQTLLPEFQELDSELTESWDVIYDARGSLFEPHTAHKVDIGTLEVRRYIRGWNDNGVGSGVTASVSPIIHTKGPTNRYQYVLYCEKEGFNELFKSVRLAEKYDIAIVSNKGMTVTSMRHLVAKMSAKGVSIFVLHDFDKAGFSIVNTLRTDTRRWSYDKEPNVIDLGFRLVDVMDLETEQVFYDSNVDPRINLIQSGATKEEAEFLRSSGRPKHWAGHRVELNAMTSRQLIQWIEKKLKAHDVKKMVPHEDILKRAFISSFKAAKLEDEVRRIRDSFKEEISVPDRLEDLIRKKIEGSSIAWDDAIKDIAFQNTIKEVRE